MRKEEKENNLRKIIKRSITIQFRRNKKGNAVN